MHFRIVEPNFDYVPALKNKELHMVGFAEVGMSYFRSFLEFTFSYNLDDAIRLCEKINHVDETGTIYPQGYLTGLPVRFFRSALNQCNIDQFKSCLRDGYFCPSRQKRSNFPVDWSPPPQEPLGIGQFGLHYPQFFSSQFPCFSAYQ